MSDHLVSFEYVIDTAIIEGQFTAFRPDGTPVAIVMQGCPDYFVGVYKTKADLRAGMKLVKVDEYEIGTIPIGRGRLFAETVIGVGMRLMVNPRIVEGNTRWTEIRLE